MPEETLTLDEAGSSRRLLVGTLVFLALFVVGLFIVKWWPYAHKALFAATTHSIGASIVSGTSANPPAVGIAAAWGYAWSYFTAVWQAIVLALLLGATIQTFVPRRWLHALIGRPGFGSTALAGVFALAGMM
jgi:uncharacterized membrane protein YraQ (UPF0718 family)